MRVEVNSAQAPEKVEKNFQLNIQASDFATNKFSICPSYQKKKCVKTEQVVGVEIFGRIRDDKNNVYSPAIFIPELKKLSILNDFSWHLLSSALDKWQENEALEKQISVAINLDIDSLLDDSFIKKLTQRSQAFSSETEVLLDFDFNQLVEANDSHLDALHQLCANGYKLAIELGITAETTNIDAVIESLPVSEIKLKHTLVSKSISDSGIDQKMTMLISTAAKYSIPVTAIGIESQQQYEKVLNSGVSNVQGFYLGSEQGRDEMFTELVGIFESQEIAQQTMHHCSTVICFSNDESFTEVMDALLSIRFQKAYYPLDIEHVEHLNISETDIIIFDLNSVKDIRIAQQIFQKLGHHFYSLVLIQPLENPHLRLEFLDMGTFDVLEKPTSPLELLAKVERMSAYVKLYQQTLVKVGESEALAFQSMQDASSYGQIVRLMKDIFTCRTYDAMAKTFFNYMESLGLSSSLYVTDGQVEQTFRSNGINCPPAEYNAYQLLREGGRLHEFGNRLVVNDVNVSFLVKNMPADAHERGRIRDYVAVVVECLQEKVISLIQTNGMETAVKDLSTISNDAISTITQASHTRKALLQKVSNDISESFHKLDLSLEQEEHLTGIIEDALDQSELVDQSINQSLEKITLVGDRLTALATLADTKQSSETGSTDETNEQGGAGDIELF